MNLRGRLFMLQGGSEDSSAALECNLGVEFGVHIFYRGPSLKQVNLFKRFFVSRNALSSVHLSKRSGRVQCCARGFLHNRAVEE